MNKNNRIYNVSGRVLALDFVIHGRCLRSIAVYVPHCGYSRQDLEDTYEQLRCIIFEAQRLNRSVIIGGGFNTRYDFGVRGILFGQISEEFGLCINNGTIPETSRDWTFRSAMGIKRRLDYICSSHSLFIGETGPTDMLNLGSDHRAVRSVFVVARKKLKHRTKNGADEGLASNY